MYASIIIYCIFFREKDKCSSGFVQPTELVISDQDLLFFFNQEVKTNMDKMIHETSSNQKDIIKALESIHHEINIATDTNTISELQGQLKTIKLNKIENIRLQSLFSKAQEVFSEDEQKIKVLKQYFVSGQAISIV